MLNKRQELASSEKIGNLVTRESVVKIITDKFPTILKVTIRKFIRIEFGNVKNIISLNLNDGNTYCG
jgi:hypothetical protein